MSSEKPEGFGVTDTPTLPDLIRYVGDDRIAGSIHDLLRWGHAEPVVPAGRCIVEDGAVIGNNVVPDGTYLLVEAADE